MPSFIKERGFGLNPIGELWAPRARRRMAHLAVVQLLGRGGAQAHEAVVLGDGPRALPWRGKPLHLGHQVQALFDVTEVASLGRHFLIGVGVLLPFVVFCTPRLQTRAFGGKFDLTLNGTETC